MPIRPEMRDRYPANWQEIRARILVRAGNRCEKCNATNHERIARSCDDDANTYMLDTADVYDADSGKHLGQCRMSDYSVARMVDVVLTIAHIHDSDPANCADDNLMALCQRCHNKLDAPMRAANARTTRRARLAVGDLFGGQTPCACWRWPRRSTRQRPTPSWLTNSQICKNSWLTKLRICKIDQHRDKRAPNTFQPLMHCTLSLVSWNISHKPCKQQTQPKLGLGCLFSSKTRQVH